MILNDLQRADYVVVNGEQIECVGGMTMQFPDGRELVVMQLQTGNCMLQFRKGNMQTGALHLESDVMDSLVIAWHRLARHRDLLKAVAEERSKCIHGNVATACIRCTMGDTK